MNRRFLPHVVAAMVAVITIGTLPAFAATVTLVADFTAGNTTAEVDGYQGMAGDGWAGAWVLGKTSGVTAVATVNDPSNFEGDELNPGLGNYLDVTMGREGSTGAGGGVIRSYKSTELGAVDWTLEHTISFTIRLDEDVDALDAFTDLDDRYVFHGRKDALAPQTGGNMGTGFLITGVSKNVGTVFPAGVAGEWTFYNGDGDDSFLSDPLKHVDTDIQLLTGHVYEFQVVVKPETKTYDAAVRDFTAGGEQGAWVWGYDLGWRDQMQADTPAFLSFAGRDGASTTGDNRHFSLDALSITGTAYQVEPVTPYGGMTTVAARFTDGVSETLVDAYHGTPGDGWKTAWTDVESGAVGEVTTTAWTPDDLEYLPVKPTTGSYLSFSAANNSSPEAPAIANAGINRNYATTTAPGIDWSKPHQIQFTIRIDEDVDLEGVFDDEQDRYNIADLTAPGARTSETCTWIVSAFSKFSDPESENFLPEVAGEWAFFNGNRDGEWSPDQQVNTDVVVHTGGVYDFTIVVKPGSQSYDATVSDGTTSFTATGLGWRTSATTIGGYLSFFTRSDDNGDVRAFSLDEIEITQLDLPAIPGDTNGDNLVDEADAKVLATYWGAAVPVGDIAKGDFNADGIVNALDAAILAAQWGDHTGGGESVAGVPEPATVVSLLGAFVMLLACRRRY
ncbi:MAG: PEP-CTERM sorting domain-containing protein [Pirellulaceae bacterium]|nr:PEP-CTERM sorting domain-containing protein [Pirellulaceae bacterium]